MTPLYASELWLASLYGHLCRGFTTLCKTSQSPSHFSFYIDGSPLGGCEAVMSASDFFQEL